MEKKRSIRDNSPKHQYQKQGRSKKYFFQKKGCIPPLLYQGLNSQTQKLLEGTFEEGQSSTILNFVLVLSRGRRCTCWSKQVHFTNGSFLKTFLSCKMTTFHHCWRQPASAHTIISAHVLGSIRVNPKRKFRARNFILKVHAQVKPKPNQKDMSEATYICSWYKNFYKQKFNIIIFRFLCEVLQRFNMQNFKALCTLVCKGQI